MKKARQVILLVDDSPLITERVIDMLRILPTVENVLTASNYQEAQAVLAEKKATTVLLDIQLPGKSGLELLKFIVKNYSGIKVLMLTNLTSEYYKRLCKKTGALHFIDKSKEFHLIPGILSSIT
jgi:DNA-binding NarL/FixJ family response regulator